jgi:hypothetical protein
MRHKRLLLFAFVTSSLFGCARTAMTSMAALEPRSHQITRVIVFADFVDLGLRQATEARFTSVNGATPVRYFAAHQLFFPGREYSAEEIQTVLRNNQIDATLMIKAGGVGATSTYIQPTFTTTCTVRNTSTGCQQATTTTTGGFDVAKPWAQFTAQLFDYRVSRVVWFATANTSGNAFASGKTLAESMADNTLERLYADRAVP